MQDRSPPARRNLLATHGRTIHEGHFRTSARSRAMSASPQRTDVAERQRQVRKVPRADVSSPALATISVLMRHRVEWDFGLLQVERAETLGEPAAGWSKEITAAALLPRSLQRRASCPLAEVQHARVQTRVTECLSASAILLFCGRIEEEYHNFHRPVTSSCRGGMVVSGGARRLTHSGLSCHYRWTPGYRRILSRPE
jgi:hypothetical protein